MTRETKTPRQRAEEALAVADRLIARLALKSKAMRADLEVVEKELDQVRVRRQYLAANPDLPNAGQLAAEAALLNDSTGQKKAP